MPSTLHTHDLIKQLKAIKEEQGLTIQNIYETLENNGYHVSLNSIKKVFAEGSENEHFRFHDTLQPISRVLLGIYGEDHGDSEVDGLRAAVQVKDELIDHLKNQIVLKDERIDRLMSRVDVLIGQLDKLLTRCEHCTAKQNNDDCT